MNALHTRPLRYLEQISRKYQEAWPMVERALADRRSGKCHGWPEWNFMPSILWEGIAKACNGLPQSFVTTREHAWIGNEATRLQSLGTWRMSKGIYAFDETLYRAVIDTPIAGDIPASVLMRLPEWGLYVPTPGLTWYDRSIELHGFWANLDSGNVTGPELNLVVDIDSPDGADVRMSIALQLQAGTIEEAIDRYVDRIVSGYKITGQAMSDDEAIRMRSLFQKLQTSLAPMLSLLLYICASAGEIGDERRRPANPAPVKTKRGLRDFAAERPTTWDVGARLGAALRAAYDQAETEERAGEGAGRVRPHVRRAHWHGYWSGSKKEGAQRDYEVRWMPPIAINVTTVDQLPAVLRPVRSSSAICTTKTA